MVKGKRVLVAMSGGVDSSMAAAILKKEGYEVIGVTMKIWPKEYCGRHKQRSCCSLQDIDDARKVCDTLDIKHYILNFEDVFRTRVIDYFIREYMKGRTPNPCIMCNEKIKFGSLLKKVDALQCDFIATGHYARIERNSFCKLRESADMAKDQSYVLFSLTSRQLQKAIFPIGGLTKGEVRAKARELGLGVHKKSDSQEICFVPQDKYSDFIREYCGIKSRKGDIVDSAGRVLGSHNGFWNFTIGQRKGLGVSFHTPLYVLAIEPKENIIVVGGSSEVKKKRFVVKDINWLYRKHGSGNFEADVKIRYNHKKAKAFLTEVAGGKVEVQFEELQEAITPGQAAVFYEGEYVLGGGWIEEVMG